MAQLSISGLDISSIGVSTSFLRTFQQQHALSGKTLTTTDVCETIIKPATASQHCAYVDLLRDTKDAATGQPVLGKATVFVSHAWKYEINDAIATMVEFAAQNQNTPQYFWFDLFINNQHEAVARPFEWWCGTFKDNIARIGTVLLIMTPWHDPIPLTRAWCLWEIFCALEQEENGVELVIRLPPGQAASLLQGVCDDANPVIEALVRIDPERADAFKKEDRDNIHSAVRKTIGYHVLGMAVKDQLRDWYLQTAVELATAASQAGECSPALNNLGKIMWQMGELEPALAMYESDLAIRLALYGEINASVATSYNNIAAVFDSAGMCEDALQCYEKSLEISRIVHGPKHRETAMCHNNIGQLYIAMGEFELALESCNTALAVFTLLAGDKDEQTAIAHRNVAQAYQGCGRHDDAVQHFHKDLTICLSVLGDKHPSTATAYSNMGNCLLSAGRTQQALEYFSKSLIIYQSTVGEMHPDTGTAYNNMATAYSKLGQLDLALELRRKSLDICLKTLGEDNPSTAQSYGNLGITLVKSGNVAEGRANLQKALAIFTATYGPDHPDTQYVASQL